MTEPHFAVRLRQRAGITDTDAVYRDLRTALANPTAYPEFIEFVMKSHDGKDIWRVHLSTGRFYIIANGAWPVTVYTQAQMRSKKATRRAHKSRK